GTPASPARHSHQGDRRGHRPAPRRTRRLPVRRGDLRAPRPHRARPGDGRSVVEHPDAGDPGLASGAAGPPRGSRRRTLLDAAVLEWISIAVEAGAATICGMFSADERSRLAAELVERARGDGRIAAAALVGSLAGGTPDAFSDIDLSLGVAGDARL